MKIINMGQIMEIAVLGGGHGCYAAAADLSEKGHHIRFWLNIAGAVTERDFYDQGRPLENLGLAGFSREQMRSLLINGVH